MIRILGSRHSFLVLIIGTRNLSDLLVQREEVSQNMQETLDDATDPWGIKVERVEM